MRGQLFYDYGEDHCDDHDDHHVDCHCDDHGDDLAEFWIKERILPVGEVQVQILALFLQGVPENSIPPDLSTYRVFFLLVPPKFG